MKKATRTARLAAAATVAAIVFGGLFAASPAFAGGDLKALKPGERMVAGDLLVSDTYQYELAMQADGNLVEYGNGHALWSTRTNGNPGAYFSMQSDDNAVVRSASGKALWSSKTPDASQNKGFVNLGLDGQVNVLGNDHTVRWHNGAPGTDTLVSGGLFGGHYLHAGSATLTQQGDGNLVARVAGKAVWSSKTAGLGSSGAFLQTDGNLVERTADKALWSTKTAGSGANTLMVSRTGVVSLLRGSTVVWTSK